MVWDSFGFYFTSYMICHIVAIPAQEYDRLLPTYVAVVAKAYINLLLAHSITAVAYSILKDVYSIIMVYIFGT